jgi:hypothetical protein
MNLHKQHKLLQKRLLLSLLQKKIYQKKQMKIKIQRLKFLQIINQQRKQQPQRQPQRQQQKQPQRQQQKQPQKQEKKIDLETLLTLNTNINKIVSCYGDPPKNGVGDFIRGCFYLFQLCDKYNISYDIVISNVIQYFLKNKNDIYKNIKLIDLNKPKVRISRDLFNSIKNDKIIKIDSNNTLLNKNFSPIHKEVIKHALEPNNEINTTVDNILQSINYKKKEYVIIHIRTGDTIKNYIDKNNIKLKMLNNIYKQINLYEEYFKTNKVFVISDNTSIKIELKKKYNFECHLDQISHFSDTKGSIESHKNTFTDLVLMSNAKQIISLTVYDNFSNTGSGFSYWTSIVYDIPYHFLRINNK